MEKERSTWTQIFWIIPLVLVLTLLVPGWLTELLHFGEKLEYDEKLTLLSEYRILVIEIITAIAVVFALLITNQRTKATQQQVLQTNEQLSLIEEGQFHSRYVNAIEMLGSAKADVRISALIILKNLVETKPQYFNEIKEIISAFIRRRAGTRKAGGMFETKFKKTYEDIVKAIDVLCFLARFEFEDKDYEIRFEDVNLNHINLNFNLLGIEEPRKINIHFWNCRLDKVRFSCSRNASILVKTYNCMLENFSEIGSMCLSRIYHFENSILHNPFFLGDSSILVEKSLVLKPRNLDDINIISAQNVIIKTSTIMGTDRNLLDSLSTFKEITGNKIYLDGKIAKSNDEILEHQNELIDWDSFELEVAEFKKEWGINLPRDFWNRSS